MEETKEKRKITMEGINIPAPFFGQYNGVAQVTGHDRLIACKC